MKRRAAPRWLLLALSVAAAGAQAQALHMFEDGAVAAFCGGVGAEERQAMTALEAQANLKLLFVTARRGGYLADAAVTVSDGKATRYSALAGGPICLLRLPPGNYRITAEFGGATRSAQRAVGPQTGKPPQVAFAFRGEPWDGIWASDEEKQQARE